MKLDKNIQISLEKIRDTSRHLHSGIEILMPIRGKLSIDIGGTIYNLKSNDVILINNKDIHSVKGNSDNLAIVLHLDKEFLQENCSEIFTKYYICNSAKIEEEDNEKFKLIRKTLTEIMLLMFRKDSGYNLQIMSKIYMLLNHIVLNFEGAKNKHEIVINAPDDRVDKILSYINRNFTEDISLNQIAKDEFISVHYLSKIFKEKTGINFSDYITELRMEDALKGLTSSKNPINKIALSSGFPNVQSFNREFKKRFNETPREYRKKNKFINEEESPQVDSILAEDSIAISELLKFMMISSP